MNALLPGGATDTGMVPEGVSGADRAHLLRPELCGPPAVYLASDGGRDVNGRRIVATTWSAENPNGEPAELSIGAAAST